MNQNELNEILEQHELWVDTDGKEGARANLAGAYLAGANLAGANLAGATLTLTPEILEALK